MDARVGLAVVACAGLALFYVYLRVTSFGSRQRFDVVLSLQAGSSALDLLSTILSKYSLRVQMASQHDVAEQRVDLSYRLLLRDPSRGQELIRELNSSGDFKQISLFDRKDEVEV